MGVFRNLAPWLIAIFSISALASTPVEIPISEVVEDVNPCTGEPITITFTGVGFVHEEGDRYIFRGVGTVVTSDGFVGTFNRNYFIKGDQIFRVRFHDMEVSSVSGQRMLFPIGLFSVTTIDGQVRSSVLQVPGPRCIG
jgi:hypothetical protein